MEIFYILIVQIYLYVKTHRTSRPFKESILPCGDLKSKTDNYKISIPMVKYTEQNNTF